jgi:hypothetical protein
LSTNNLYKRLSTRSNIILVLAVSVLFLIILTFEIGRISGKSYFISEKDLHRIDSVIVRTRAYFHQGGGKGGSTMIEFDDKRGNNLRLSGSSYSATRDQSQLYDTLQYYGTSLTIYILNEEVNEYYDEDFDRIKIYGLKIGAKSYLLPENVNKEEYNKRFDFLIFASLCYCLFLIIHIARVNRILVASQIDKGS